MKMYILIDKFDNDDFVDPETKYLLNIEDENIEEETGRKNC